MKRGNGMKQCPNCKHQVEDQTKVCPYCGYAFLDQPKIIKISFPIWPFMTIAFLIVFYVMLRLVSPSSSSHPSMEPNAALGSYEQEVDEIVLERFKSYATFSSYFSNGADVLDDALRFESDLESFMKEAGMSYKRQEQATVFSSYRVETQTSYVVEYNGQSARIIYIQDKNGKESLRVGYEAKGKTFEALGFYEDETHPFFALYSYLAQENFSDDQYEAVVERFNDLEATFHHYEGRLSHYGIGIDEATYSIDIYPNYQEDGYISQFYFNINRG